MLPQRIITAVILGIIVLLGLWFLPPTGFNILAAVIILIASWEFSGLFKNWDYTKRWGFLAILVICGFITQFIPFLLVLIVGDSWWLIAPYFLWRSRIKRKECFTQLIWQVTLGIVTFVPAWVSLITMRKIFGIEFLFYLFVVIWAADIGAYFAGRFWGKHLLAPKISPKKTWEGVIGGVILALLVAWAWLLPIKLLASNSVNLKFSGLSTITLLILTIVTCLWSVIGDLFESMLKRQAGIKDSGRLLPGHGGMYDRIDSLIAALPIFTAGLLFT